MTSPDLMPRAILGMRLERIAGGVDTALRRDVFNQRRLGKMEHSDKRLSCLTAARLPRIRRDHAETNPSGAKRRLQG